MLKNYLKTAWRNLAKQKLLTFINIFGLSAGIACFTLFTLYAVNEFSFDNFHRNKDNIYGVYPWIGEKAAPPGAANIFEQMPLGPAMKNDLPDVESYVRI